MGVMLPEVLAAADELASVGTGTDVVCLTSADLVYRSLQARRGLRPGDDAILDRIFPADRAAPIVTVVDGHPHTLAFLSNIHGQRSTGLGVSDFGRSGDVGDLYRAFGIDTATIVGAAWDLLDEAG
jgi:pyruvate dehydrogenase E1 component